MNKELHNLTSDAEGEEMLTVEANLVKELYQRAKEVEEESKRIYSPLVAAKYRGVQRAIEDLFGSKCLPDEVDNEDNFAKTDANEDNFTSKEEKKRHVSTKEVCEILGIDESEATTLVKSEPKPSEPKFRKDEKVRIKGVAGFDVIKSIYGTGKDGYRYELVDEIAIYDESDLEPYTEQSKVESATLHAESVEESRNASEESNLSNSSQDCDEWFDTIIKRGFRADRRCNIAVQMINAMMGCPEIIDRISSAEADSLLDDILHDALYLTDNLIAECEKGGEK